MLRVVLFLVSALQVSGLGISEPQAEESGSVAAENLDPKPQTLNPQP